MGSIGSWNIEPSQGVLYQGKYHIVLAILDIDEVLVGEPRSSESRRVKASDLGPLGNVTDQNHVDLESIPDEDWAVAMKRFETIRPLLDVHVRTREMVKMRASECGLHHSTIYKWISLFETTGLVSALLPRRRSDVGKPRTSQEINRIIDVVIREEYLTVQRKSVRAISREVRKRCIDLELDPPHENTIRNRINRIPDEVRMAKRYGSKAAALKYKPIRGSLDEAKTPLSVVQIDHTMVNLIVVDEEQRQPVGRPWITVAIDVYSRMVLGFYVSFDPPSALSVGLCLAHAILPKEEWLSKRSVEAEWPCYGLPSLVHADNAKEFRGHMLKKACFEYQIDLAWRPARRPQYGAHIERLLGTFKEDIKSLPGTTFSDPKARGDYDSEKHAIFTLAQFEAWLANFVHAYHIKKHSGISMPPIEKLRLGILGDAKAPGSGLPRRVEDSDRLRLDLMPFVERTIQNYGISIEKILYYDDSLRRWIHSSDPTNKKLKRKFIFRFDPRDISQIWFFDPDLRRYFPVRYKNRTHPAISVWELRKVRSQLDSEGTKNPDEAAIFRVYDRMRELEAEAGGSTKAIRKSIERRKHGAKDVLRVKANMNPLEEVAIPHSDLDFDSVVPFEEMDDMRGAND